jgi:mono/diheme cytochrome c family protein
MGVLIAVAAMLFLIALVLGEMRQGGSATRDAAPERSIGAADATVERGKYLADAGNCSSCHTRPGGALFSGGLPFATPFGTLYSSNITPDNQTGIGRWVVGDLRRAMHGGVAADGHRLYPAFPYASFTKVSDEDVAAIYAYLRTLAPVHYSPPANAFLFSQRWGMIFWNALFFRPGRFESDPARSPEWNRGAYLVEGLGHCGACHSPRNVFLAEETDKPYAGGSFEDNVSADKIRRWSSANLTSAKTGLAAWSVEDLAKYLKTGVCRRAGSFGPMNEVIVNSLRNLSNEDVHAIAVYLKGLPSRESADTAAAVDGTKVGAAIYQERCEKCHLSSGRGGMFNGPPLAGSAVVQDEDPASLINVILYGPESPKEISFGLWETMKPYGEVLDDADLAAVSNYVRRSWGNRGRTISPSEVAQQR